MILEWFDKWVTAMGTDLPEKFNMVGFANGGFQAGLYASKCPNRIDKVLLLAPSQFCPAPTQKWNPYKKELDPSQSVLSSTSPHLFSGYKDMAIADLTTTLIS